MTRAAPAPLCILLYPKIVPRVGILGGKRGFSLVFWLIFYCGSWHYWAAARHDGVRCDESNYPDCRQNARGERRRNEVRDLTFCYPSRLWINLYIHRRCNAPINPTLTLLVPLNSLSIILLILASYELFQVLMPRRNPQEQ